MSRIERKSKTCVYVFFLCCCQKIFFSRTVYLAYRMFFLMILILILLTCFYVKCKYFTLHGSLSGLSSHFLFGNLIHSGALLGNVSHPQVLSTSKARFGDIFQFWICPWHLIVVSEIDDMKHSFTHRNIYDQGDLFAQQISVFYSDGLICTKGENLNNHHLTKRFL